MITEAQYELMDRMVKSRYPLAVVDYYKPAQVLIRLGYAQRDKRGHLELTYEGRKKWDALHAEKNKAL